MCASLLGGSIQGVFCLGEQWFRFRFFVDSNMRCNVKTFGTLYFMWTHSVTFGFKLRVNTNFPKLLQVLAWANVVMAIGNALWVWDILRLRMYWQVECGRLWLY